jgi:hypothetical protein
MLQNHYPSADKEAAFADGRRAVLKSSGAVLGASLVTRRAVSQEEQWKISRIQIAGA